jgi:hypothetical protein
MAKKTRAELSTEAVTTNLPDNNQELITPATERAQLASERESTLNYKDDITGTVGQVLVVGADGESIEFQDLGGGDVLKTGTIVANEIAIWNDNDSTLRSDPTLTIDADHKITLYQPNSVPTDLSNYNIGGGNINTVTGTNNTGFGKDNLNSVTTGDRNIAFGGKSLENNITGIDNVAVGYLSLNNNTSSSNVAVGSGSMQWSTTGSSNVAVGNGSMSGALGFTTGSSNVAVGNNSMLQITSGSGNVCIGHYSSYNITTGSSNTTIGSSSGSHITTGSNNLVLNNDGCTTGSNNILIGGGGSITSGSKNIIIGSFTGTTGESPTPVYDIRTSSNNIVISDGDGNIRQTFDNSGAATFSSSVTAGNELSILGGDGGGKILYFTGGTTKYNFMIAAQQNANNGLEITPSTTAGGSTFSTPALTIASTGAATFSGQINANNGISFPTPSPASSGTVVASVLDAYEEGTWTGVMTCDSGTITLSTIKQGTYTRIGRQVTVVGYFTVASVSGTQTGLVYVDTLPFTNGTGSDHYSPVTVFINTMLSSATSVIEGFVPPNTKQIVLFRFSNGSALNVADSFKAGSELMFSLTYFV